MRSPRAYSDPYLAGFALGLVLLACFALTGRGLGASGAFVSAAAGLTSAVAPGQAARTPAFARHLASAGPWREWLLFELGGVMIGGFVSALLNGRIRATIERGPQLAARSRLLLAFTGGGVMGAGALIARGCTSGLALTGGSLLAVGSWAFLLAAFAAAYAVAPLLRRIWL